MNRFLPIIAAILIVRSALVTAETLTSKPADTTVSEQQVTEQIKAMEQTLHGLPPSSPDRATLALNLMRLKQLQRATRPQPVTASPATASPATRASNDLAAATSIPTTQGNVPSFDPASLSSDEIRDERDRRLKPITLALADARKQVYSEKRATPAKDKDIQKIRSLMVEEVRVREMPDTEIANEIVKARKAAWEENQKVENRKLAWNVKVSSLRVAAENNDIGAMKELVRLLLNVDDKQVLYWSRKAADLGDVDATYFVGLCYLQSIGIPYDAGNKELAIPWLRKAVAKGSREAAEMLTRLDNNDRQMAQTKVESTEKESVRKEPNHLRCPLCGGLGSYGTTGTGLIEKYAIGSNVPLHTCEKCAGKGWVYADP